MIKPATTQKVAATLRKAGFRAGRSAGRRVVSGYSLETNRYTGNVHIRFMSNSNQLDAGDTLDQYAQTLTNAGIRNEIVIHDSGTSWIVAYDYEISK